MFENIGCDIHQCNNLIELDYNDYETEEYPLHNPNPVKTPSDFLRLEFDKLLNLEELKEASHKDRIDLVSWYYRNCQRIPRSDISKLFMVIVIPDFVKKYDLLEDLIEMDDYRLFLNILACSIHELNMTSGHQNNMNAAII